MFDLETRDEEEEENPGHRSILGLEAIRFDAAPRSAVPIPDSKQLPVARSSAGEVGSGPSPRETAAPREIDVPRFELDLGGSDGEEENPGHRSILGLEAIRFHVPPRPAASAVASRDSVVLRSSTAQPESRSSRDRLVARDLLSLREPVALPEIDVPQFERDLAPNIERPIPFERAILLSLIAHVLLFLLLLWAPAGTTTERRHGLLAGLFPETPKEQDKIPIVFRAAPGPERENAKRSDLSDKTRRAGGGDPSRPRADTPFVPQRPGIEGLSPGAGKMARAAPPQRAAPGQEAERSASAAAERSKASPEAFNLAPPSSGAASGAEGPKLANLQRAIQDAARQVGGGEGGAGSPNPEGGFVDSGPISFDTSWYDWGAYAEEMVRRIKLHWEIPELARLGWKGKLTIRFYIMADGRVEGAKYISHSGIPPFDFAAFNAILKSDPFKPLPRDLLAEVPGKDREGITVTFFYNIRPEKE